MKIGIIGAGNMAEALINGLKSSGVKDVFISDINKSRLLLLKKKYNALCVSSNIELVKKTNVIILAVKPHNVGTVLGQVRDFLTTRHLIISIAAGIKIGYIEKMISGRPAVIRVMPNTPALISKGISAVCVGRFALSRHKKIAIEIFSCVGNVIEVKEAMMDLVTAVSGSGPAYFFFLTETLMNVAVKAGLNKELARQLAAQTALGAAALMVCTKQQPYLLRQKVTSKAGTTQAAFDVFEKYGLEKILKKGINAAIKRSRGLSCSY